MIITDRQFKSQIEGKNVVVVGPAGSIKNARQGQLIDSFDVIVRIGQPFPLREFEHFGMITDVVYNALDNALISGGNIEEQAKLWKENSVKTVVAAYPDSAHSAPEETRDVGLDLAFVRRDDYNQLHEELGSRPSTGVIAIAHLLKQNPRILHIIGIDFYRSMYASPEYKSKTGVGKWNHDDLKADQEFGQFPNSKDHHNPDKQFMWLKDRAATDSRISLDTTIAPYFTDPKYEKWERFANES